MKNTRFLQPHKRRRVPLGSLNALAVVIALAVAAGSPLWLEQGLLVMTTPLWRARAALAQGVTVVAGRLVPRRELEAENRRLSEENARLRLKVALYDERQAEVDRLETLMGRSDAANMILARVLASPSASPYDSFIVDVGARHGITKGDRVVFGDTVALGEVDVVTSKSARVSLYSTPGTTRDVYVGTTTTRIELTGEGGGMFIARIPKDVPVEEHDALMMPDSHDVIAFVRSVVAKDTDAFQTVIAVMPINIFEAREVIIRPSMK